MNRENVKSETDNIEIDNVETDNDFIIELERKKKDFEAYLHTFFIKGNSEYQDALYDSMKYSLRAGGKRIRPIFLIECAKLFGAKEMDAMPFAAAMEMIHTYSLIHDDLPAMDNDALRRGKPTNHVMYGEATAILAGDALLNSAHTIMIEAVLNNASHVRYAHAAYEISSKAGSNGMIVGQIADIANENTTTDIKTLDYINANKTGALLEASFAAGAMIGGANENEIDIMRKIARAIGLSFQIIDDILDIEGDTVTLGKPVGSDQKNLKTTYPLLLGLEASKNKAKELTRDAVTLLKSISGETEFLEKLILELLDRKL